MFTVYELLEEAGKAQASRVKEAEATLREVRVSGIGIGNGKWERYRKMECREKIHEITEKLLTAKYGSKEYRELQAELLSIIL